MLLPNMSAARRAASTIWWRSPRPSARPSTMCNVRLNFPNRHPLDCRMNKDVFRDADLILSLDCRDWERPTHVQSTASTAPGALLSRSIANGPISGSPISRFPNGRWAIRIPECAARVLATPSWQFPSSRGSAASASRRTRASPSASPSAPPRSRYATMQRSRDGARKSHEDWDRLADRAAAARPRSVGA